MYRIGMMTENVMKFKSMKKALKVIKDLGYDCADISLLTRKKMSKMNSYFNHFDYKKRALKIKEYANSINLPLVQSHAPFPVIKIGDDKYNKKMHSNLIRCIEICGILGITNLVIHPFNDYNDDQNVDFFKDLLPIAKENNVIICCENMFRWNKQTQRVRPCACSLIDSFKYTLDTVNDPNLKACVDIGHAQLFSHHDLNPRKLLLGLNERVICLHIHDNDGIRDKHLIPFKGIIDYKEVIKGLKEINYKNDLIVETKLPKECFTFKKACKFWKEQL